MSQATLPTSTVGPLPQVRFKSRSARQWKDRAFVAVCLFAATLSIVSLVVLITSIIQQALGFEYSHPLPYLLLGACVFGIGAGGIGSLVLLPGVLRGRAKPGARRPVLVCGVLFVLSAIGIAILWQMREGQNWLTWDFLTGVPSRFPTEAGIWPATIGTMLICLVCALTAIPIGVATAILLEEFRPRRRWLKRPHAFVQLNISNLAGVPSIVYGILGLTAFVQMFNAMGTPLDPAFSWGVEWHDRFLMEDGTALLVPVADRGEDPTRPGDVAEWRNEAGEAVDVRVVERDAVLPQIQAVDDRVDRFEEALEAGLEAGPLDAAAIDALVTRAWAGAGLEAELAGVKPAIVAALTTAQEVTGRDRRRAMRSAMEAAESAEKARLLPNVLLADAYPSRVSDTQPWFVRLPFGRGVLAGGLTLMLVVLPIVIISSQEALRAVPRSMRQASLALGATPWQTVWKTTLPTAVPGIMTGTILAMSRAIGEAAPILVIAGIVYITYTPGHLMDDFTAMPLQIFNWAGRPQPEFHNIAAAGIIILMAVLLSFNALAVFIRQRTQKQM